MNLRALTDDVLLSRLKALVAEERGSLACVIEHLLEVERREIVVDRGFPSLFIYCMRELGYSESAAYARIRAARAALERPELLEHLRSGRLSLDTVVRISPHLKGEAAAALIESAQGASKIEVLRLVAAREPDVTRKHDSIRPIPPAKHSSEQEENLFESRSENVSAPRASNSILLPPPRVRFSFDADDELVLLVERLRARLRHKYPAGRLEDIFKAATRAMIDRLERTVRENLRNNRPTKSSSRRVPASIRRAVWGRDEGRCAYVSPDGLRCESRDALEYDHITPWALGGRSDTPENIRLLCRPHNQRLGRKRFGPRKRTGGG